MPCERRPSLYHVDEFPDITDADTSRRGSSRNKKRFRTHLNPMKLVLPSFLSSTAPGPSSPTPTTYLDGLRGVASVIVANSHLLHAYHPNLYFAYGQGIDHKKWLLQLPFIRLIHSGDAMVALFFILSGYVLSYRPLLLLRSGNTDQLHTSLSSSVFRRGMRLYIPTVASTFVVMIGAYVGLYDNMHESLADDLLPAIRFVTLRHAPSLWQQIGEWLLDMHSVLTPWTWSTEILSITYGTHLWTIVVEFRCSLVLFTVILGLSQVRPLSRLIIAAGILVYSMACGRWDVALFLGGLVLAELNIIHPRTSPYQILDGSIEEKPRDTSRWSSLLWVLALLIGLYFASQPEVNAVLAPGFIHLSHLIPDSFPVYDLTRFWYAIGAVLVLSSVSRVGILQKPFCTPLARYLGRISFALYLVHIPVMSSFGYWLLPKVWSMTGTDSILRYEGGFILALCAIVAVIIWTADLFHRIVEEPSIRLARWFEDICMKPERKRLKSFS